VNAEISPGVKVAGGLVQHVMNELEISCLPKDLPEFIQIDLKDLQAGHSLHLSGVTLPPGVEPIVPKGEDPTVATVVIPKVMTAEEELAEAALLTAAPAAAEVPTVNQKAVEDAAAGGGGGAGSKPTVKDDKKNMKEAKDKK
jgi:large subunit ribosomal protein L25